LEKESGQLVHRVPERMRDGVTEAIEVRLGRTNHVMTLGIMGSGDVIMEDLPIVDSTQLAKGSLIWNTSFDQQKFGRWLWKVTPKKSGTHELIVKVSADLSDSRGVSTSEPYGDRMFSIGVRVNYGTASLRVSKWAATGAVTGLVGAYTHEVWWRKAKVWLMGAGLLS
jgi:hypothetical protein